MYKGYFEWFSNVSKFMYKGTFSMISSNVYLKSMYKDFSKYIFFMYIQKNFSMILFLFECIHKKNLKDLKNMYKLQSGNMYKIFPFLFFKISMCRIKNFW